jgi:hypothetical protein
VHSCSTLTAISLGSSARVAHHLWMLARLATSSPWILDVRSCAIRAVMDSLSTPRDGCCCVWRGRGPADLRAVADSRLFILLCIEFDTNLFCIKFRSCRCPCCSTQLSSQIQCILYAFRDLHHFYCSVALQGIVVCYLTFLYSITLMLTFSMASYPWCSNIQCEYPVWSNDLPILKNFFPSTDTKTGCTIAEQCHSKLVNGNQECKEKWNWVPKGVLFFP